MDVFLTVGLPIFLIFATPALVVWLCLRHISKKEESNNRLIEKALELNMDINPELFIKPKKDVVTINRQLLIWGLALAFLGFAAFIILFILTDITYASLALLLFFPGLSFLIARQLIIKDSKKG